jgi:hypothetical protein
LWFVFEKKICFYLSEPPPYKQKLMAAGGYRGKQGGPPEPLLTGLSPV